MCILYYGYWESAYAEEDDIFIIPEESIDPHEFLNPEEDYYYMGTENDIRWWINNPNG